MTTVQDSTGTDDLEAVLALVDSEPVPLDEHDDDGDDDGYEQRAAEHLGDDDPHDEADVLTDVELSDVDAAGAG